jgi:hypothetical protein
MDVPKQKVMVQITDSILKQLGRKAQAVTALGPHLSITPFFATTYDELRQRLPTPSKVFISQESTLVIKGEGEVTIHSLKLRGTLLITAEKGTRVTVKDFAVDNKGWQFEVLNEDQEYSEVIQIRGYELRKYQQAEVTYRSPGDYTLSGKMNNGLVRK